jgi:hypothetical protein
MPNVKVTIITIESIYWNFLKELRDYYGQALEKKLINTGEVKNQRQRWTEIRT